MSSSPVGRRAARGEVTSYGEDRVCDEPDCRTRLSRYNGTAYCSAHEQPGSGSGSRF